MKQLLLASAVACVSWAITEAGISAGLRAAAARRSPKLGKLLSCGYCAGHWVALAILLSCRPQWFPEHGYCGYVLTWLALSWLAGAMWALMRFFMPQDG
jgi:hypothetical protein